MSPHFTSLCLAVALSATTLSTAVFAQPSSPSHATIAGRKAVSTKPAPRQAALATRSSASPVQPVSQSVKASTAPVADQPVASPPAPAPVVTHTKRAAAPQTVALSAKYLNVGVGAAAYYGGGFPVGASFEMDIKENLSVGGSLDYMRYAGGYNLFYLGARGSYHVASLFELQNPSFDPYVGATLGYRHIGYSYAYEGRSGGLFLGIHAGARYFFSDKLGGFAEVGYGISALKLGLTAKS